MYISSEFAALARFDTVATLHKMKSGVTDLPVEVPGLIRVLDEIAKIHVSISGGFTVTSKKYDVQRNSTVAVLAFKAAYNMERTRRETDKRTLLLYVAMKDMLSVLIQ